MGSDGHGLWRLRVQQPNRDPVPREVPEPESIDDLRVSLGVDSAQIMMTTHPDHPQQQFIIERVSQVKNGSLIVLCVPRHRIFISLPPDIKRKAVTWYAGTKVEQIEKAIVKAAGLPLGTAIELRDAETIVALSEDLPNDTHLEVAVYVERKPEPRSRGRTSGGSMNTASLQGQESRPSTVRMHASLSSRSVINTGTPGPGSSSVRRDRSPQRATSPMRSTSVGASTTPAAHQSAPEEHCVHILAGHTGFVFSLCGVGDILFTGSQDNHIMIWDLNNLQYIGTLPGHRGFVKSMHASLARKVLCSGSQDRTIRVWSLDSFSTVKTLHGHTGGVNAVLILEAAGVLVSGSEDRSLRVWDLGTYDLMTCLDQAHLGGIFALERFGSPVQIVSGARDRSLKVWDSSTWQVARTLHPPHYDGVTSIAVSSKHKKFYSGSRDRSIKEWDVNALTNTMHTLHVHSDWVQALCVSASDDVLFSGSRDSTVKVWDGELQCQDVLQGHSGPVSSLCTMGGRLFSASHDRTVRVWRIDQYG